MLLRTIFLSLLLSITAICPAQDIDEIFKDNVEVYFSFTADDIVKLESIGKFISIDNVTPDNLVYAYAGKKGFAAFMNEGIQYEILQHPGTLIQPRMLDFVDIKNIDAWDFYPSYNTYVDMMYQYETDFPGICDVFSIGTTNNGRELLVARISDNVGQAEGEPKFLYTSSIHGDETTGYILMLRLIDYLLNSYGTNPRLTTMVNEIDIFINPLANPDGSYYSGNSNIYGAQRYNANGVDLNRNYPDPEDGPHPDGYPWQTETIHFMNFAEEHHFSMSANIHGGTEVCNYPFDTWPRLAADDEWWKYVCREYADTAHDNSPWGYMNGYDNGITNGYAWYTISGGRQDYMNYFHQTREFTLEISDVKLLPANQLPALWDYNYRSLLNYLEQVMFGVSGRITDSASGEPLKAEVYVLGHEEDSSWVYSSLPDGNYSRLLDEGTYDIRYSKNGYYSKVYENVLVTNRQATILDVELSIGFSSIGESTESDFSIYPNPARGNFIKVQSETPANSISIFSIHGELIQQVTLTGDKMAYIDISALDAGTYIMQMERNGKVAQRKFVKL